MPTLIIKTNASQVTDVLVKDMGILIPNSGGSETFTDIENLDDARLSLNLRALCTDDTYGAGSSTLILNDGSQDIAQEQVDSFLADVSGIKGETGTVGYTGAIGYTGSEGLTGLYGVTGLPGPTGYQGHTGYQGYTGSQGTTGLEGITGIIGETGAQGYTGTEGPTGIVGVTGLAGETGVQGYTGLVGETGAQGYTGIEGVTGLLGITGLTGLTGAQGYMGAQGFTGTVGNTGIQGQTGSQGLTGLQGVTGSGGITGLSYLASITKDFETGLISFPAQNGMHLDNTDPSLAEEIAVDGLDGTGGVIDSERFFASVGAYDLLRLQNFTGDFNYYLVIQVNKNEGPDPNYTVQVQHAVIYPGYATDNLGYASGDAPALTHIAAMGVTGLSGATGSTGSTGMEGVTGVQGVQGSTGFQGYTGAQGVTGVAGITGFIGFTGAQGYTGSQGETGSAGVTGLVGLTGAQGITGIQGTTGSQGLTGIVGITGLIGITGLQGVTGIQGTTGSQGLTGAQGTTGLANFLDRPDFPAIGVPPILLWNEQDEALYAGVTGVGKWVQISAGSMQGSTGVQQAVTGALGILIDGADNAISTGMKGDIIVPYNLAIDNWTLVGQPTGSILLGIWKSTYANYPPTITDAMHSGVTGPFFNLGIKNQGSASNWGTPSASINDIIRINVDSCTGVQMASLSLNYHRT